MSGPISAVLKSDCSHAIIGIGDIATRRRRRDQKRRTRFDRGRRAGKGAGEVKHRHGPSVGILSRSQASLKCGQHGLLDRLAINAVQFSEIHQ